jgi:hypothetical protein
VPDSRPLSAFKAASDQREAIDRLRWRIPGVLATSGRPGRDKGRQHSPTVEDVEGWVQAAQQMGLKSIICFLESRKLAKWYGGLYEGGLLGRYRRGGFKVYHFEAEDYQPVAEDVRAQSFKAFASAPKPVVLQDSGGVDRTGAVARYIAKRLGNSSRHV